MTDDPIETLLSARHYCFLRGVAGQHQNGDFRAAFRELNRLYVELKGQNGQGNRTALRSGATGKGQKSSKKTPKAPGSPQIALFTSLMLALALFSPASQASPWYRSKRFWIPLAADSAAMAVDYATSQQAFARGGHETNPIFGARRPSAGRMVSIGLPIAWATAYAGHRLDESRRFHSLFWIPSALAAADHTRLAIRNTHVCPARDACR